MPNWIRLLQRSQSCLDDSHHLQHKQAQPLPMFPLTQIFSFYSLWDWSRCCQSISVIEKISHERSAHQEGTVGEESNEQVEGGGTSPEDAS